MVSYMAVSQHLRLYFLLLSARLALPISIDQVIPKNNLPVCPNGTLQYNCTSSTGTLLVQYDEITHIFHNMSSLNTTGVIGSFVVQLVKQHGSSLIVTATSMFTNSSNQGKRFVVYDGDGTFFARDVTVAAGPDACQGIVTCSIEPLSNNSQSSNLVISLNSTHYSSRCIKGYNFSLDGESQLTPTDPAIANFSIDRSRGQPYLNQKIYPIDGEGRQGEYPCFFSITAPNPITVSFKAESCDGNVTKVTIVFDVPTFPPENCLDTHTVKLNYHITSPDGVFDEPIDTLDNSVMILADQQTEFVLYITPTLPDLGISGTPYTTTIVITTQCSPCSDQSTDDCSQNSSIVIVATVGVLVVLLPLIISLQFFISLIYKRKCTYQDNNKAHGVGERNPSPITEVEMQATHQPNDAKMRKGIQSRRRMHRQETLTQLIQLMNQASNGSGEDIIVEIVPEGTELLEHESNPSSPIIFGVRPMTSDSSINSSTPLLGPETSKL